VALKTVVLPIDVEEPKLVEPSNVPEVRVPCPWKPSMLPGDVRDAKAMINEAMDR
jgi:hypothetical protein